MRVCVCVCVGLENAERNVLPTLNNLLENREMSLDDGRFLMPKPANWEAKPDNSDNKNLVFVHEGFRVIGLSVPVPSYSGRALDPPLRSRFQCRFIDEYPSDYLLSSTDTTGVSHENVLSLVQFYESLRNLRDESIQDDTTLANLPIFPQEAFHQSLKFLRLFPDMTPLDVVSRFVPTATWMSDVLPERFQYPMEQISSALAPGTHPHTRAKGDKKRQKSLTPFNGSAENSKYTLSNISPPSSSGDDLSRSCAVTFSPTRDSRGSGGGDVSVTAVSGERDISALPGGGDSLLTDSTLLPRQREVMSALAMDHAMDQHMCLLGPKV
jgi:hypothetical protein